MYVSRIVQRVAVLRDILLGIVLIDMNRAGSLMVLVHAVLFRIVWRVYSCLSKVASLFSLIQKLLRA